MWLIADTAGNPLLAVMDGRDFACDFPATSKASSGPAPITSQKLSEIGAQRSKLIEAYRNAKPRSKEAFSTEAELRRVTHEILRGR